MKKTYDIRVWDYSKGLTSILDDYPVTGILVKLSGGADSSIVYYKLCKELSERNLDFPLYVGTLDAEGKDWYSHYAKKVIKFTKLHTGIEPIEHRVEYLSNPWTITDYENVQDKMMNKFINQGLVNVYYGGLTQNPSSSDMVNQGFDVPGMTFKSKQECINVSKQKDSKRDNHNLKYSVGYGSGPTRNRIPYMGITPFVHEDKKQGSYNMYEQLGLLDSLFPITYSCEERDTNFKDVLSVVDGYQEHSHCGQCWFCLERAYAFGRLV